MRFECEELHSRHEDKWETTLGDHIWEQVEDKYIASGETLEATGKEVVHFDRIWKTTGSCGEQLENHWETRFQSSRDPAGTLHMRGEGGKSGYPGDTTSLLLFSLKPSKVRK